MMSRTLPVLSLLLLAPAVWTQEAKPSVEEAFAASSAAVRVFDQHVTTLSNPIYEGRLPGTRGAEMGREYVEWHFRRAGLEAPFPAAVSATNPGPSYRQVFPLGGRRGFATMHLSLADTVLKPTQDYLPLDVGSGGDVTGELIFVGYGIDKGPDGFTSYPGSIDLKGKIAVLLRFEPMSAEGNSLWATGDRPWSEQAGFEAKLRAATARGALGVIIVNPPGCADPRSRELSATASNQPIANVPVAMVSLAAGERLLAAAAKTTTMDALKGHAQRGGAPFSLGEGRLMAQTSVDGLTAENVGGLLRGKGRLADELIVMGGHLDHLGLGAFGSRASAAERGKVLHPGADDNASGVAAIIMIAEQLVRIYANLPSDSEARSILFVGFDAEESGLNGSRFYTTRPIRPLDQHALMINFDMIGRVQNNRLSVSGTGTAKGMKEWLEPLFAESPLEIRQSSGAGGGSDHASFARVGVPVIFAIGSLHADYHTPRDEAWKINRTAGVQTIDLFTRILETAALRREPFERTSGGRGQ